MTSGIVVVVVAVVDVESPATMLEAIAGFNWTNMDDMPISFLHLALMA